MRSYSPVAYTLVELLVALALSLLLLLGVIELLSRVGGAMNDTRAAMGTSANLHEAAILLRQDLAHIPDSLATKPARIVAGVDDVSDRDGYLEIIEGPDTLDHHPYVDESGNPDPTVGDVDDIIAFTAFANRTRGLGPTDFRGLVLSDDGEYRIEETEAAEIAWFVRGNTLYRRVRLIKDDDMVNPVSARADRKNRLLHTFDENDSNLIASPTNEFPFPLYDLRPKYAGWRYLRLPTLEETIHINWTAPQWKTIEIPRDPTELHPDLWEQPHFFPNLQDKKSGSLTDYISSPRHVRAGEDVVLTNVLSFDVKVWCSTARDFVDLGMVGTTWDNSNNRQSALPRTWDSWTQEGVYSGKTPPYAAPLEAVKITIRCFDPASRAVKQVTVVHRFK